MCKPISDECVAPAEPLSSRLQAYTDGAFERLAAAGAVVSGALHRGQARISAAFAPPERSNVCGVAPEPQAPSSPPPHVPVPVVVEDTCSLEMKAELDAARAELQARAAQARTPPLPPLMPAKPLSTRTPAQSKRDGTRASRRSALSSLTPFSWPSHWQATKTAAIAAARIQAELDAARAATASSAKIKIELEVRARDHLVAWLTDSGLDGGRDACRLGGLLLWVSVPAPSSCTRGAPCLGSQS